MIKEFNKIRKLISQSHYEFTEHAYDGMAQDFLEEEEVITAIKNGFITKKQRDLHKEAPFVYTILGESDTGVWVYVAGKIIENELKIFKIITAKEDKS